MNYVFLIVLNSIKAFLSSEIASFILICAVPSVALVFLTMLIIQITVKKTLKLRIFNGYLIALTIIISNVFIANNQYAKKLLVSFLDYSVYVSSFILLAIIGNITLSAVKRKSKNVAYTYNLLKVQKQTENHKNVEVIPCTEEGASVYSGYIDVNYVKSLIDKLKENSLEFEDEKEVEEFEIYLLNFVNRQPNGIERKRLSEYMGSLMKKLAKYNAI